VTYHLLTKALILRHVALKQHGGDMDEAMIVKDLCIFEHLAVTVVKGEASD